MFLAANIELQTTLISKGAFKKLIILHFQHLYHSDHEGQ
jgi:hypothetical protein